VATVARVATASLLVRSTPAGAMITMNGAARGVTPRPLRDLEFGDHTIVVSRSGYRPVERQVSLTADRPSRAIEVALAPEDPGRASPAPADTAGSLVIDSRPTGATVTIDGRRAGVTPVAVTTLPGRHSVRLERPGYRAWATTIDMQAGARARVAGSLVGGQEEE